MRGMQDVDVTFLERLFFFFFGLSSGFVQALGFWLGWWTTAEELFLQWALLHGSHIGRESPVWPPENVRVSQPTCA